MLTAPLGERCSSVLIWFTYFLSTRAHWAEFILLNAQTEFASFATFSFLSSSRRTDTLSLPRAHLHLDEPIKIHKLPKPPLLPPPPHRISTTFSFVSGFFLKVKNNKVQLDDLGDCGALKWICVEEKRWRRAACCADRKINVFSFLLIHFALPLSISSSFFRGWQLESHLH